LTTEPDESLDEIRQAVRAYPDVADQLPTVTVNKCGQPPSASTATDALPPPGHFPPHLEVKCRIAQTQMSTTWKAFDHDCKAFVVIKEPRTHIVIDPDAIKRFVHEVELVAKMAHTNIVLFRMTHLSEPPYYFTMPFIEGEHLDVYCDRPQASFRERLRLFLTVCRAVIHAHQQGVIHRDLKPNNILVDEDGKPHLLDFGLGRLFDSQVEHPPADAGSPMGTPGYMAPEQAKGLPGDIRTDVYALGVVLFRLLTGRLPLEPAQDLTEMLRRIREDAPAEPIKLKPDLNYELNAIVLKALAKNPDERYQNVNGLAQDLEDHLVGKPVIALPRTIPYLAKKWLLRNKSAAAIGGLVLIGIVAFTAFAADLWHSETQRAAEKHIKNVMTGRFQTARDDPVNASGILWKEHLNHESIRTRFALWEFYRRYPCVCYVDGHGRQTDVEYSPDGKWIVTVGWDVANNGPDDGRLIIYAAATGHVVQQIPTERVRARCVCFGPQGKRLYVGCADGNIRVWDVSAGTKALQGDPVLTLSVTQEPIRCLAVAPNDGWLAAGTGYAEGTVYVWRMTGDKILPNAACQWRDLGLGVGDLAFSCDSSRLACGADGYCPESDLPHGGVWVWELPSGEQVGRRVDGQCRAVLFSSDGERVFYERTVTDRKPQLAVWNLANGDEEVLNATPQRGIRSIDSLGHVAGRFIAFAAGDGRVRFYDTEQRQICSPLGFHDSSVSDHIDVCFSPDGHFVASVGKDGLRVWESSSASSVQLDPGNPAGWNQHVLSIVNDDGSPVATLEKVHAGEVFETRYNNIGLSRRHDLFSVPALNAVWVVAGYDTTACETARISPFLAVVPGENQKLAHPILSDAGDRLALLSSAKDVLPRRVVTIDISNVGEPPLVIDSGAGISACPCWLETDSRLLLLGLIDGSLQAWRQGLPYGADNPERIDVPQFNTGCSAIAVTSDGQYVATSSEGAHDIGRVAVWHSNGLSLANHTFAEVYGRPFVFPTHPYAWTIAFVKDRDGRLLVATGGSVREVHVWEVETGELVTKLIGHRDAIRQCIALNERMLVTASDDHTVHVWDVWEQEEVCVLYEGRTDAPFISVRDGRIAIVDGDTLTIADTRDIQRFIDGNQISKQRGDE